MTWVDGVREGSFHAVAAVTRSAPDPAGAAPGAVPATVPVCRCGGQCRCGSLVPYLLHRQLELECEFYRDVH